MKYLLTDNKLLYHLIYLIIILYYFKYKMLKQFAQSIQRLFTATKEDGSSSNKAAKTDVRKDLQIVPKKGALTQTSLN